MNDDRAVNLLADIINKLDRLTDLVESLIPPPVEPTPRCKHCDDYIMGRYCGFCGIITD